MLKVVKINETSVYLDMVIELGDVNSATLGFLPRGAFINFAARKQILYERRLLTKITDVHLSNEIIDALDESGFIHIDNTWVKVNLPTIKTIDSLHSQFKSLQVCFPEIESILIKLSDSLKTACSTNNVQLLLNIERVLYPCKIMNINIPLLVVPIKPEWAKDLFDLNLATQDIFGGKSSTLLNVENVYYRKNSNRKFSAPARILWYVSKGSSYFSRSHAPALQNGR